MEMAACDVVSVSVFYDCCSIGIRMLPYRFLVFKPNAKEPHTTAVDMIDLIYRGAI